MKLLLDTGDLMKTLPEFDQPLNGRLSKVAIIGAANAGKSTILNRLVGRKVRIQSYIISHVSLR